MTALTLATLSRENQRFADTMGVSRHNAGLGFRPAFRDSSTGVVYLSQFADGRPAPFHLLDGLPNEAVLARSATGRVTAIKAGMESGFVRVGRFYTRAQAAQYQAA